MDMSASGLRLWLTVSQILLACGVLSVVLGAVGVMLLTAGQEKLAVERILTRAPAVAHPEDGEARREVAALQAANLALQTRLDLAEHNRPAVAHDLEVAHAAPAQTPQAPQSPEPRTLTEGQKARLMAALKAIPGPPEVHLVVLGDPEANAYGMSLVRVLEAAGYRGQLQSVPALTPPLYGVNLTVKPADPKGAALKYAFGAVPIPVIVSEGEVGAFDAEIVIGLNPR